MANDLTATERRFLTPGQYGQLTEGATRARMLANITNQNLYCAWQNISPDFSPSVTNI
jgi:hypothetical protein